MMPRRVDRVLYVAAAAILSMHGLYHLWADYLGMPPDKNLLVIFFGPGPMGQMMHIAEWPIILSALAVAFLTHNEAR